MARIAFRSVARMWQILMIFYDGKRDCPRSKFFSNFQSFKSENDTKSRIKMKNIGDVSQKVGSRKQNRGNPVTPLKILKRRRENLVYVGICVGYLYGAEDILGQWGQSFYIKFLKYFFFAAHYNHFCRIPSRSSSRYQAKAGSWCLAITSV